MGRLSDRWGLVKATLVNASMQGPAKWLREDNTGAVAIDANNEMSQRIQTSTQRKYPSCRARPVVNGLSYSKLNGPARFGSRQRKQPEDTDVKDQQLKRLVVRLQTLCMLRQRLGADLDSVRLPRGIVAGCIRVKARTTL